MAPSGAGRLLSSSSLLAAALGPPLSSSWEAARQLSGGTAQALQHPSPLAWLQQVSRPFWGTVGGGLCCSWPPQRRVCRRDLAAGIPPFSSVGEGGGHKWPMQPLSGRGLPRWGPGKKKILGHWWGCGGVEPALPLGLGLPPLCGPCLSPSRAGRLSATSDTGEDVVRLSRLPHSPPFS